MNNDIHMLPESNWEADSLRYEAKVLNSFSYRGWVLREENDTLSEDPEDIPWEVFDPDCLHDINLDSEQKEDILVDLDSESRICYGVVSISKL